MTRFAMFFVENRKFTFVLTIAVLLFGASGLLTVKSESFPSVDLGAVVITTFYKGATASDIETKITKPIEEEIRSVTGIKKVVSSSQAGISRIVTVVDIDRYAVADVIPDLQRAIDRTTGLPADLDTPPDFIEIKSDEFPVIEVAVIGSNAARQRDRIADALKEEFEDNKKVSNVMLSGFRERQFNILLDRQKLDAEHIAINEVMAAVMSRNVTIPAGELKSASEQKLLRIEGKAGSRAELENIMIRANFSGRGVKIKDVATVEDGQEEPLTLARYNGEEATLLTISKKGGADLIELSSEIEKVISQYRETYKGQLDFVIFSNEGKRVGQRLSVLNSNAIMGLVLVVIFLMIFLPGRVGIMTAISLPICVLATVGMIPTLGYTLNTITILGFIIAIGMLVDNAIVIAENFVRLRDEGMETRVAIEKTIRDLWVPVTATFLTTVAAFLPMLVTSGILGQFIKAMPIIVSVALLISLLESFWFLPSRLDMIGKKIKSAQTGAKLDWFQRFILPPFNSVMDAFVRYRYLVFLAFMGLMAGSVVMMVKFNKFILFPADQTEIYLARVEMPSGTRIETTDRITGKLMLQIREKLGDRLAHVSARTGAAETDPMDPKGRSGSAVALVTIFVTDDTKNTAVTQKILEELRTIKQPELINLSFEALVNGPPIGDPVDVTFRSNDLEQLNAVAVAMRDKLQAQPGISDAKIDDVFGDEEILLRIDYEKVARLGLSLQEIGATVRAAIAGQILGDVNLNNREVDYFIRFEDKDRRNMNQLTSLKIADRQGNLIPLGQLTRFEPSAGMPQIKRYDYRRAKTVTAGLDDNVTTSVAANQFVKEQFAAMQAQYPDVTLTFGGEGENTNESFASLLQALILSMVGIFALLVLIFRSYIRPFIIMTTIPLGLVGMSLAFYFHQRPISFLAIIGIIGLGGIIVNSGIVLISFIEQMREETTKSLHEILVSASSQRLRAVIVTSLTTVSGLLPTAYGIGGTDDFIIPIALALAWGLTSGTILTLVWVPCAYAILEDFTELRIRLMQRLTRSHTRTMSASSTEAS